MSLESCKISGCKRWRQINIHTHDPTPQSMCLPYCAASAHEAHFQHTYLTIGPNAARKGQLSSLERQGPRLPHLHTYS